MKWQIGQKSQGRKQKAEQAGSTGKKVESRAPGKMKGIGVGKVAGLICSTPAKKVGPH